MLNCHLYFITFRLYFKRIVLSFSDKVFNNKHFYAQTACVVGPSKSISNFVCQPACRTACLFVCQPACRTACLFVCHLPAYLPSIYLSAYLPSVCLYAYLFTCLSTCRHASISLLPCISSIYYQASEHIPVLSIGHPASTVLLTLSLLWRKRKNHGQTQNVSSQLL